MANPDTPFSLHPGARTFGMTMDTIPSTKTPDMQRWLALSSLLAIPVLVPVGLWGTRGLWPRALRLATTGALTLGVLSLIGLSLRMLPLESAPLPAGERWKLPLHGPVIPEEFAASAASCR